MDPIVKRKKYHLDPRTKLFLIVVIAKIIYAAFSITKMLINGSFYAKVLGSTSSSLLDKKTIDKIDERIDNIIKSLKDMDAGHSQSTIKELQGVKSIINKLEE